LLPTCQSCLSCFKSEIVGKEKATEGDGGLESGKKRLPAKKTPNNRIATGALIYIKNSKAAGRAKPTALPCRPKTARCRRETSKTHHWGLSNRRAAALLGPTGEV
jgi:hypothetical protein